jgi:uroporphyrinogen-III synthase
MRVIVTRPLAQAAAWVDALKALGCDAQALPLIDIAAVGDTGPLHRAWSTLAQYSLVMFVSANAVQHFFALASSAGSWPAGVRAGATGPGTSAALRTAGVPEAAVVEPPADAASFDSEALWARLAHEDWMGRKALVVRGEDGRDWLAEALRARGAAVDFVAAYRRLAPQPDAVGRRLLADAQAQPSQHVWLFSSSEAVGHLARLVPQADWSGAAAMASHPRIAAAARAAGFGRVELIEPSPTSVAQAIEAGPSIQSTAL